MECGRVPTPVHQKQPPVAEAAEPDAPRGAYTVKTACRRLGNIGRTTVYGLIADGKLEAVKLGSRTLITAASIDALLASLPRVQNKHEPQRDDITR
jgi:excisionase family DNA binding protein